MKYKIKQNICLKQTKEIKPKLEKRFCAQDLSLQWEKHQLSKLEITNFSEKAKTVEASKAN